MSDVIAVRAGLLEEREHNLFVVEADELDLTLTEDWPTTLEVVDELRSKHTLFTRMSYATRGGQEAGAYYRSRDGATLFVVA